MLENELSINPPSFIFDSARLSNSRQGEYEYLSKTVCLIPPEQFPDSIREHIRWASGQLEMEEFFPGQNQILLRGIEGYVDYCDTLLKDLSARNKRWDSIVAHEIAHHIFLSSIDRYEKLDYLIRNPKEILHDQWEKMNRFAVLFRGLEELNSTLFELSQYKDPGAVFILIDPLWERVFYDPFSQGTQIDDIKRICNADHLSGEYGLAVLSLFAMELLGTGSSKSTPYEVHNKVLEQLDFFLQKPDEFINKRVQWYEEVKGRLHEEASNIIKQI